MLSNSIKIKFNIGLMTILLMFLFLPKPVNGISLSTLQKNKYSQVRVGESTEFTVLFWNSEKSSFPVELSVESLSKNLSVFITPNKFTIEPSLVTELPAEAGKEYVDTRQGLMKATPVRIIVKPSDNAVLGEYDIYVKTIVGSPKLGISTLLERTFKFTVNVTSPPTFSEQLSKITGRISETVKDVSNKITGMVTTGPATNLVLLIIVIIVLAFVIWFIRFRK